MKKVNVSVIGLSGTEKDKGQVGVGKSCLCNRFIRPAADDYFIDHISVLSQTDFSGRIVNNDHFLYWGSVKKCTEEGVEYSFQIVEQTEFIDDSTFQSFKVGKMESYTKRCTALKVLSAEKLMYICKNQLGIEKEYEQKVLPEGRLTIDGFLVIFDVSLVPNRSIEKQIEFVHNVIIAILKIKKPLVLVTTKNDDASEAYIREAEKICQRKEYKGLIQIVETSAHESINVDLAFMILAQIIDKVKNRTKLVSYQEAARSRKEILDLRTEAVTRLIRNQITDYHTLWSQGSIKLAQYGEWNEFLNIFGQDAGLKIFRRHLKKLHNDHLNKKLQQYMDKLPYALRKLIPDINLLKRDSEDEWAFSKNYLRNHRDFDQFFLECQEVSWEELDDLDNKQNESLIPFDVLETSEAETVFRNHLNSMQQDKKKNGWKQQFKLLLQESGFVTPGKQLCEVRVLFMGRECFEALSEHDCQQIYDIHQAEITEKSKRNFIEMLLEHAELFLQFKTIDIITQEDVTHISDVLQDDSRYKILDRLDQERNIVLLQHLEFIHCPIRENCPFYENCIDNLIEDILTEKAGSMIKTKWDIEKSMNLLIMGSEHLASDLLNDIRIYTGIKGEYVYENRTYYLKFCIANGDIEAFKSVDISSSGLICVYSNMQSFETLKDNLEKSLLCNLELEDKFENLPIVIVFQPHDIKENKIEYLRSEGIRLSEILHCEFIENQQSDQQNYVSEILNIVTFSLKFSDIKVSDSLTSPNLIDLRILVCMFCGDQYELDNIIVPLIAESSLCKSTEHSIIIDIFIGDEKRRVEFILSSYHGINEYNNELIHGVVYFYSCKRRSALANLTMITSQISNIPSQFIAITECGGANAFFNSDVSQFLITEGNALADRCKGNFMTFSFDQYIKLAFYIPFFKNVCDNKFDIANLQADESVTLDSGEGTLENCRSQLPRSPPRHESYVHSNTLGSHNENCKILATTRSLNSLNEEKDIQLDEGYDGNIEKRNLRSQGFRIFPPPTTPPEPAPPDREMLCTIKNQLVSASNSSLGEIASDVSGSKDSLSMQNSGWLDDTRIKNYSGNNDTETNCNKSMLWNNFRGSKHAYTTGRRHIDSNLSKFRPKGPSQTLKQPGKLNLNNFQLVSEAVARMNFGGDSILSTLDTDKDPKRYTIFEHSQLDIDGNGHSGDSVTYEKISKIYENEDFTESDSCASSADKKMEQYSGYSKNTKKLQSNKKTKKKRVAIPVQTPRIPIFGSYASPPEIPRRFQKMSEKENDKINGSDAKYIYTTSNIESRLYHHDLEVSTNLYATDTIVDTKSSGKCLKELGKSERRRLKEESTRLKKLQEKEKDHDKKLKRKFKQNLKGLSDIADKPVSSRHEFLMLTGKNNIPVFLVKCVEYIEQEGLDSEGIYRVPGSRAHVELLFQKFEEDLHLDIKNLDIPVNAVATALKDFFSKRLPPLFNKELVKEIEDISAVSKTLLSSKLNEVKSDKSCRLIALKTLLAKIPPHNFITLKYVFQHFVHVAENSKLNSMDSKNLAICWWPTLIPIDFTDMGHFEQLRPYLEDIVQTMIDQYPYLFCGKDAFVMV